MIGDKKKIGAVGLVVAMGCAAGAAEPQRSCPEEMRELGAWAKALAQEETGVWLAGDLVTVSFASDRPSPDVSFGIGVGIDAEGVSVQGGKVWLAGGDLAALPAALGANIGQHLALARRIAESRSQRFDLRTVGLGIAPGATWAIVAKTLNELSRQGFRQADFAFLRTVKVAAPPPSAVDQALAKFEREMTDGEAINSMVPHHLKRIYMLREQMRVVLASCPESLAAYDRTASGKLPAQFSDEMSQCRCQPDIGAIRTVLWNLRRPSTGALITARLAARRGAKTVVALPADTPWSVAHASIVKAARQPSAPPLAFAVSR